jgi:hypothetical protein
VGPRIWRYINRLASVWTLKLALVAIVPTAVVAVVTYLEDPERRVQAPLESSVTTIGWVLIASLVLAFALWLLTVLIGLLVLGILEDPFYIVILAILGGFGWTVYESVHGLGLKSVPSSAAEVVGWAWLGLLAISLCLLLIGGLLALLAILLISKVELCTKCGQRLPGRAKFCPACGDPIPSLPERDISAS